MVLVCGSRSWANESAVREQLEALPADTILVYRGYLGAVKIAQRIAEEMGLAAEQLPDEWKPATVVQTLIDRSLRPTLVLSFGPSPQIAEAHKNRISLNTFYA